MINQSTLISKSVSVFCYERDLMLSFSLETRPMLMNHKNQLLDIWGLNTDNYLIVRTIVLNICYP